MPSHNGSPRGVKGVEISALVQACASYLPPERVEAMQQAYEFAARCHRDQLRLSGEPFIEHPLHTALYLADLRLDTTTVQAALLHDVIEDCGVSYEELSRHFGEEVARLVDGVTKLSRLDLMRQQDGAGPRWAGEERDSNAESLRKMLVSMAQDERVVLIKLADRLHNMRTLKALPAPRRRAIAQETLDIYAPLAHRLGIGDIKWRLEDMAFRYLEPQRYREVSRLLAAKREARERYVTQVRRLFKAELEKAGIKAEVQGRPKHLYSVYQKMEKYAEQGKEFGQIYDLFALRVLVPTVQECYHALGIAHSLWRPLPGQFDDYIANPKDNLYQSLHTAVMCPDGAPVEIQIRTQQMHQVAEYGVAAHWSYKEGSATDARFEEKMTWLRQILEWQREVSGTEEFLEGVRSDLFQDQVFVYTPKGDIKELPTGATPIDFAYQIHTDLGHRCIGAKVNGKLVPLDSQLQNGDTVQVLTTRTARGPSLDWLNPNLGYARTSNARQKIRQWFNKQERSANVQRGRELLQKELRRHSLSLDEAEVARTLKYDSPEELLAELGNGSLSVSQVTARLTAVPVAPQPETQQPLPVAPTTGIEVLGVGDLLVRMARCCSPLPGDDIIGYITRTRGVTVHKRECPNVIHEDEQERLVPVNWGSTQPLYPVRLRIDAWDRVGLLRDVTTLVSGDKVNIAWVVTQEHEDNTVSMFLTVHTTGIGQLSRLFARLEGVKGVYSVSRTNGGEAVVALTSNGMKLETSQHE